MGRLPALHARLPAYYHESLYGLARSNAATRAGRGSTIRTVFTRAVWPRMIVTAFRWLRIERDKQPPCIPSQYAALRRPRLHDHLKVNKTLADDEPLRFA
jgi:hypothetical protein